MVATKRGQTHDEIVDPVVVETVEVSRRQVETGRVRVHKSVREHEQVVDEPLLREVVEVERVPIGRAVERAPECRWEGDTWIVPVLEEVVEVRRRLVLTEEIRVTRRRSEIHQPLTIWLRSEQVTVERVHAPKERSEP